MVNQDSKWTTGNNNEQKFERMERRRAGNANWRAIDDMSTPFYVTNFPPGTTSNELWRLCAKFGRIADVFIPPQLSKYGKKFAFVKYLNVNGEQAKRDMVDKLRTLWIGSYHVYATVARFGRRDMRKPSMSESNTMKSKQENSQQTYFNGEDVNKGHGVSFANIVRGAKEGVKQVHLPVINMPEDCLVEVEEEQLKYMVAVKDPKVIKNFPKICMEEGFDIGVRYVGGRWIMIEFPSLIALEGFRENATIMNLVRDIKAISNLFVVDERLIWIDIKGLPACAWTDKAIKKVVERWGELLFFEDDDQYPLASRRVCIAYNKKEQLCETVHVMIRKKEYLVKVEELIEWEVEIKSDVNSEAGGDESTESEFENYENEHFDDNEDVVAEDHMSQEKEEILHESDKFDVGENKEEMMKNLFGSKSVGGGSNGSQKTAKEDEVISKPRPGSEANSKTSMTMEGMPNYESRKEKPGNFMESSSRSLNSKGTRSGSFLQDEVNRLMELGKVLGVKLGNKEELYEKLKSMGVLHVDP